MLEIVRAGNLNLDLPLEWLVHGDSFIFRADNET